MFCLHTSEEAYVSSNASSKAFSTTTPGRYYCNLCGVFSKTASTPMTHQGIAECRNFAEKRHRHFQQKRQEMAREVSFNVNGEKIDKVSEFKYLGRILEETDDDEHAAN